MTFPGLSHDFLGKVFHLLAGERIDIPALLFCFSDKLWVFQGLEIGFTEKLEPVRWDTPGVTAIGRPSVAATKMTLVRRLPASGVLC